jgi:hypothetical protein
MSNVVVVGAGGIGTRHVQALVGAGIDATIHVVDTNSESLQKSRDALGARSQSISFHRSVRCLPQHFAVAVIATSAKDRRRAFEDLLGCASVDSVVFEKVLFTKLSDYRAVGDQLASSNISAWVNCPRRTWPGYRKTKSVFFGQGPVSMRITGSSWGLASNAVHAMDTFSFVTGRVIDEVVGDAIEPSGRKAKREGYVEVFGRLEAHTVSGDDVQLTCFEKGNLPRLTEFVSPDARVIIDEKMARAAWYRDGNWSVEDFSFVNVSDMGPVYREIILRGACDLPTYAESQKQHQMLLVALGKRLCIDALSDQEIAIT